jgi:enoyl-CoA hydratase/carnithine racemase
LGERFDAAQAEHWGLLTKVVEPENLESETTKLAERCLKVGGKAAAATKHLLTQAWMLDSESLATEIDRARSASIETGEFTESMQVYREKRRPRV